METRLCPHCRKPHPIASRVCPTSGQALNWTRPTCAACGRELRPGARFCYACGAPAPGKRFYPERRPAASGDTRGGIAASAAASAAAHEAITAPTPRRISPSIESSPAIGRTAAPPPQTYNRLGAERLVPSRSLLLLLGVLVAAAVGLALLWSRRDAARRPPDPLSGIAAASTVPLLPSDTPTASVAPQNSPTAPAATAPAVSFGPTRIASATLPALETRARYSLAFFSNHDPDPGIYLMDPENPEDVRRVPFPAEYEIVSQPTFCGGRLAFEAADRSLNLPTWVFLYDLQADDLQPVAIAAGAPERMSQPRCSPDGRFLAVTTFQAGLRSLSFINLDDGTIAAQIPAGDYANLGFATWPQAGDVVVWMGVRSSGYFDINSTTSILAVPPGQTKMLAQGKYPAISPDGSRLGFFCGNLLNLCMAAYPSLELLFRIPVSYFKQINKKDVPATAAWTADGQWLYYSSSILGNWDVYRMHPDGSQIQNLTEAWTSDEFLPAAR